MIRGGRLSEVGYEVGRVGDIYPESESPNKMQWRAASNRRPRNRVLSIITNNALPQSHNAENAGHFLELWKQHSLHARGNFLNASG